MRTDKFLWDLEAARFGADFNLFQRAHCLGDDVIATQAEALQRVLSQ